MSLLRQSISSAAEDIGPAVPVVVGIPVQRVFVALLAIIALLALGFVTTHLVMLQTGHRVQFGLRDLFNMDGEANLPAWFSAMQLLVAAILLSLIALAKTRARDVHRWLWWGLAAGFFLMSADEGAQLHELLNRPGHALHAGDDGAFLFSWVVFAIPVVIAIGLVYLRFLLSLPPRTRFAFVLAAACFLGGAVGFEVLEGLFAEAWGLARRTYDWGMAGDFDAKYMVLVLVEESLEMIGVAIFVRALLEYIDDQFGRLTIAVRR